MKQTVNFNQFVDSFNNAGRQDNFSYEGLQAIFEYITDYEQDSGEEIELDVIAICCEWGEDMPSVIADYYDIDLSDIDQEDGDAIAECVMDYLDGASPYAQLLDNGTIVYVEF